MLTQATPTTTMFKHLLSNFVRVESIWLLFCKTQIVLSAIDELTPMPESRGRLIPSVNCDVRRSSTDTFKLCTHSSSDMKLAINASLANYLANSDCACSQFPHCFWSSSEHLVHNQSENISYLIGHLHLNGGLIGCRSKNGHSQSIVWLKEIGLCSV